MLIERPPQWFRRLFPGAIFRLPANRNSGKRVFLTFDDGPVPEATPFVLDTLDDFGAKATFFMVGENVLRYPALAEEVKRRGHAIGNHTFHHLKGSGVDIEDYLRDCRASNEIIGSHLFRPPHGWISGKQFRELKKHYTVVMYDLVTRDYSKWLDADDVVRNVRKFSRDGSVIVFHDSVKSMPRLKEALPRALQWLSEQGYSFDILK